ncbi:hypothetical protein GmHk_08G023322 [Glycine max]|nr:hypothetical protein GmHk_08G023322 [Glycine max]
MASYGGEFVLDSSSPWSGISNHLSSFSIPLPMIFKKQMTPLMKKIQGLQTPHGAASCGIRASSSRC